VLRVNFPLEGKTPLQYYKAVSSQAAMDVGTINARTLQEHQAVLCRLTMPPAAAAALPPFSTAQCLANLSVSPSATSPSSSAGALSPYPGLPPVFASLSRFITSFCTAYVLVKGFVDHAGSKIKDACERIKEEMIAQAQSTEGVPKLSRVASMEASAAIEACVFAGVWRKVWNGLIDLYRAEETRTQQMLASAVATSMEDLGVRAELVCEPTLAVQHLQQELNGPAAVTPLHKLAVLEDTNKLLTQAVDAKLAAVAAARARTNNSDKQDVALAADDMLPFWIYLLVHARPAHIHANMLFMHHFQPSSSFLNTSQLKVHLANLQGAVQFVDSGQIGASRGVGVLSIGQQPPGPRRTRSTSTIITNSMASLSVRDSGNGHQQHAAAAGGFNSRSARHGDAQNLLASIEDEYRELQEELRHPASARQPTVSVSTHTSRSNSPHQGRSMTMTHAAYAQYQQQLARQPSLQPPRNELPATRSRSPQAPMGRQSSLSLATGPSPAVAAVAASSVGRMGEFLSTLQQRDDGATGRLAPGSLGPMAGMRPESTRAASVSHQQQLQASRRATGPIPSSTRNSSSSSNSMLQSSPMMLRLDDEDLPPLIVQRTGETTNRRRF